MLRDNDSDDGGSKTEEAARWNELCERWDRIRQQFEIAGTPVDDVQRLVEDGETSWFDCDPYEEGPLRDHRRTLTRDTWEQIKVKAAEAIRSRRMNVETANLGWDQLVPAVRDIERNGGYISVSATNGKLTGGHGTGVTWKAVGWKSKQEVIGSVPDNTHGRSPSALNGARGAVKEALVIHNDEVEDAARTLSWPSYL